jgi:putative hydrolase of the HAD superfamily
MSPRVVFFDFGGTLANLAPSINEPWKVWARVAREFGLKISDSQIQKANESADRHFKGRIYAYHGRTRDFWHVRDTWVMDQLGMVARKQEFFDALQALFGDPTLVQLYPETTEVLGELRRAGFRLGVISNFTDGLIPLLKHHGLAAILDTVTYSQEVGAEKPDPRVFSLALKRIGCRADEAVHVGDSWESDFLGAKRAGLRAIWLNRDGVEPPGPGEMIRSLREIPNLLKA